MYSKRRINKNKPVCGSDQNRLYTMKNHTQNKPAPDLWEDGIANSGTSFNTPPEIANDLQKYPKKSRAWLNTPPKNWTSAILRAWYRDKPHLIED